VVTRTLDIEGIEYLEASEAFENSKINYKLDARGEQSPKRHGGFDLKVQFQWGQ
jgi:hypothetical protein